MKKIVILTIFLSALLLVAASGCLDTWTAPVIKVNIILVEKENFVEVENYTLTPGNVNYFNRPRSNNAKSFPAIAARATFLEGNNSVIGPWETLSYNGSGTYSFNIGFDKKRYPKADDMIHVSIMVVDKDGERIGYLVKDIVWSDEQ